MLVPKKKFKLNFLCKGFQEILHNVDLETGVKLLDVVEVTTGNLDYPELNLEN
jgi:hypothetical protein